MSGNSQSVRKQNPLSFPPYPHLKKQKTNGGANKQVQNCGSYYVIDDIRHTRHVPTYCLRHTWHVPTKRQTLGQSREANKEVPQIAGHLLADRRWLQKGYISIDPLVKMPNFTADMFLPLDAIQIILDIVRFHLHDYELVSELFYNATLLFILGLNIFA